MLSRIHEIELISNFYITFYTYDVDICDKGTINLHDDRRIDVIMRKMNENELIRIVYNNDTLEEFTKFISYFMSQELNIKTRDERFNICLMKNIIINPSLI